MMKLFVILGSFNMAIAILMGAFGAHGLTGKVTDKMLANWNTGAHYHLIHALALMVIPLLFPKMTEGTHLLSAAGWLIFIGILLFSGSLYVMVLTGVKALGAITPIGGVSFIMGWILVMIAATRHWHGGG